MLSGIAATLAHDLFLHHGIPNGLYLFVILALGYCWKGAREETRRAAAPLGVPARAGLAVLCALPLVPAAVYVSRLASADANILTCRAAARAGDDGEVRLRGERAANARLYQTDYHFYYGAALERLAATNPRVDRTQRLRMAEAQMELASERTLSPVSNLVSLALLRVRLGALDGAREAIERAERLDPASHLPHLAWASYWLEAGDLERAIGAYHAARDLGAPWTRLERLNATILTALKAAPDSERPRLRGMFLGKVGSGE
jgi:hypothetical protein